MAEQPVVIQRISWADVCPWMILFRALPIATSFTVLVLGTVGAVVSPAGWWLSDALILNETTRDSAEVVAWQTGGFQGQAMVNPEVSWSSWLSGGPASAFYQMVEPFAQVFGFPSSMRVWWYFLLGGCWNIVWWSFIGLAITRVSLLQMTRHEHIGISEAFGYAIQKWTTALGALVSPLVATILLAIPLMLLGLLLGLDLGVMVVGLGWFLVLLAATGMGLLLLGLMFGWPLVIASVSCEGQNSFDAMTRAFAYTFQRPLRYLAYALIALIVGGLAAWLAMALVDGIVGLGYWGTSWGANLTAENRIGVVMGGPIVVDGQLVEPSNSLEVGTTLIGWWTELFRSVATGFIYGLSWCLAGAIYLLLRFDIDETEMDEIFISEDQRSYQLPPLKSDENGIPQVQPPAPVPADPTDVAGQNSDTEANNDASNSAADEQGD